MKTRYHALGAMAVTGLAGYLGGEGAAILIGGCGSMLYPPLIEPAIDGVIDGTRFVGRKTGADEMLKRALGLNAGGRLAARIADDARSGFWGLTVPLKIRYWLVGDDISPCVGDPPPPGDDEVRITIGNDGSVTASHYTDGKLDSAGDNPAVARLSPDGLIDRDIHMRAGAPIPGGRPVRAPDPEDRPALR